MSTRVFDLLDTFSSLTAPTDILLNFTGLKRFANVAAFEAAKGSVSANGDIFLNTTTGLIQYYESQWLSISETKKNYIINGAMDFWQRGTSFAAASTGVYTADRWKYRKTGTMVHTISRSTTVPTSAQAFFKPNYSLKMDVTTAQAVIGAGDFCGQEYSIEGYDFLELSGQQITVSFWVYSTKTGIHSVAFKNSASDRSYVSEYTISSTNTWEEKTITFTHDESGSWVYDNGIGLTIFFAQACGSTFHAPSNGSWQSGNYLASANQVNGVDSTSNDFHICLAKVERGPIATPFIRCGGSIAGELSKALRYYETINPTLGSPFPYTTGDKYFLSFFNTDVFTSSAMYPTQFYKVTKRVAPTARVADHLGSIGKFSTVATGGVFTGNLTPGDVVAFIDRITVQAGATGSHAGVAFYWEVDADF